ncbi:glycosyltransferase family 4 protein [Spirosoma utsteinense]|uniref:Glycosyltransferase involved in cell wall biosynthesis n=1 Tax=Spirosoma utsteinense TaxID=2585773 RepID=A0ABR6W5X6_9BACT|nr:glycosyltransferase family 1 protein [Spirosoma utsteinense]MBC3786332.1 glycosyltransferase involved in cell wall biosynthesis [Spirosoma utsteinense]MBC3791958.1 glycosyltransferase involved in cell wall biosynthesis [Spirosoma utsteinense]
MKVLYDHQSFTGMTYGGVSRYFFDLMRSFANRQDIEFELSLRLSNNEYLDQASFSRHIRYRSLSQVRNVNRVASVLNRIHSLRRIRAGAFDVFHPTYYHRYFLNALGSKPFVLTFHDAASERFGDIYPELGEGLYEIKKKLIERADVIISVSEFSKQEILHYFPVDPAKVSVVHLGTAFGTEQVNGTSLQASEPFPYVLYVGKRGFYKNFNGFFRAIQPVLHRHPDLHVICAGGGTFNSDEQAMFHNARLDKRVHYRPVTDAGLMSLYRHARAFVFPSLNEGFGIPVLEAFSGNCPVILSNRSSLPEVGADAAVYFDPEDDTAIADAVERVITDEALREDLIRKGTERLKNFSCDKTAQQTLDIYRTLC